MLKLQYFGHLMRRADSFEKTERVTDRKARGLQMEEIACKCQTFFSLLSCRRKQTSNIFFLLYTNLKMVTPWKKSYDQPCQHTKSRDITLPTKVRLVKAIVFPVVIYGCESWAIRNAEHRRIDTFELWCWRRLLRIPWSARRSNQSILKEISPGCSLERLMLNLKHQYFGHLM